MAGAGQHHTIEPLGAFLHLQLYKPYTPRPHNKANLCCTKLAEEEKREKKKEKKEKKKEKKRGKRKRKKREKREKKREKRKRKRRKK